MRFAHIADTHIRNLKYHHEYNEVFDQLYKSLEEQDVDYIVHCGDIAHTKTQISPEFVEMCSKFLSRLANIAPTYVILGNHDGNLKNASRQDAITPIAEALQNPNLFILKRAQEVVLEDKFALNVLSVFDEENWSEPSNKQLVNIALYHGAIDRSKTDLNWTLTGDHDISIFDRFDFAFLGDIHKTQILDHKGKVRYAGSTVQQNFGESLDKGYLLWDITSKDKFTCKLHTFKNPKPFVTIFLNSKGELPNNINAPPGARLRVVSENNIPLARMRRALDLVKHKYKPDTLTYMNRASSKGSEVDVSSVSTKEDLRDIEVQQRLIREYLNDYEITDEVMNRILLLNSKYNTSIEEEEEVYRNINWSLKSVEWDNLFNYGKGNKVNFDKLSGIVGIFGKNFSGKSSIIDSLLYTMYNSTSKSVRKNLNFINQNEVNAFGRTVIEIGDRTYTIERKSEKYLKKLKGVETIEAKTSADFVCVDAMGQVEELNALARGGTDKEIRRYFGTLEDFLMTSMTSQMDSLTFINQGVTERKKILAKFLDLEIFDKKFKMAKKDSAEAKALLKKLEEIDFEGQLEEANEALELSNKRLVESQSKCSSLEEQAQQLAIKMEGIKAKVDSAPSELIDPVRLKKQIRAKENTISTAKVENESYTEQISSDSVTLEKMEKFVEQFDVGSYQEKLNLINTKSKDLDLLLSEIKSYSEQRTRLYKKQDLLSEVPCGDKFPNCKFIKDAYGSLDLVKVVESKMSVVSKKANEVGNEISELQPDKVGEYLEKYNQLVEKKNRLASSLASLKLNKERNEGLIYKEEADLKPLNSRMAEYEGNKDAMESLEELLLERQALQTESPKVKREWDACKSDTNDLFREIGSNEQVVKTLQAKKLELQSLREEYSAFELYIKCCHSNGISYDIIKNRLPVINEEIAKILTGIVDFETFILDDDKDLNIFIKHPKYDPRPLEMGSGAEKTIASMAIRLALLAVTNLPKPDLFIMDEPGTALDEDNMEGFVRIIDMAKTYFKTVILISHLDALKDSVDTQINIDKLGSYAHVNV
ncbi:MAG: AAA family ATPase [Candidatus Peribacter sp.]|jgi:DNA repair exonuclease SbcCD ATPase subunit/DNA repair exonuclease SbcCD nuclease subunit|nr:AAA family ATPase [Candidatus Peribacter sp.]